MPGTALPMVAGRRAEVRGLGERDEAGLGGAVEVEEDVAERGPSTSMASGPGSGAPPREDRRASERVS